LDRQEAVALLKELITLNLALPTVVFLQENKRGKFDLVIKADCNSPQLTKFIAEKNFVLSENKENSYCIISKPDP
jgi:hypothetical protein